MVPGILPASPNHEIHGILRETDVTGERSRLLRGLFFEAVLPPDPFGRSAPVLEARTDFPGFLFPSAARYLEPFPLKGLEVRGNEPEEVPGIPVLYHTVGEFPGYGAWRPPTMAGRVARYGHLPGPLARRRGETSQAGRLVI